MAKKRTIVHMKRTAKNLEDLAERSGWPKSIHVEDRRGENTGEDLLRRMFSESAYPPMLPPGEFDSPLAQAAGVNDIGAAAARSIMSPGMAEGGEVKPSLFDKAFGTNGVERYQFWPEKMVRSALSAPHDAMTGQLGAPGSREFTEAAIPRAQDLAGVAMLGGMPMAQRGALGMAGGKLGRNLEGDFYYHGTSSNNLKSIQENGLGAGRKRVSLTSSPDTAAMEANYAVHGDPYPNTARATGAGGKPVVLKVRKDHPSFSEQRWQQDKGYLSDEDWGTNIFRKNHIIPWEAITIKKGYAEGGGVEDLPQLAPPPDTGIGMWPSIKSGVAAAADFLTPDYLRTPPNQPLPPSGQEGKIPPNQPMGVEALPILGIEAAGNLTGAGLGKAAMAVGAPIAGKAAAMVRKLSPLGFYSHAAEVAEKLPQLKGTPQQFESMLVKAGVKPDELANAGWQQFVSNKPMLTKDEVAQLFQQRMPKVAETRLGNSRYTADDEGLGQLAEDAANDIEVWRKLGLSRREFENFGTPEARSDYLAMDIPDVLDSYLRGEAKAAKFQEYTLPGGQNYREVLLTLPSNNKTPWAKYDSGVDFQSSHWDEPNVVAHLRMADRTGPGGEKILHLEELQSDWAQKGRREGFRQPTGTGRDKLQQEYDALFDSDRFNPQTGELIPSNPDRAAELSRQLYPRAGGSVPNAPYVTSTPGWTDLALKRALREAAEGGYDRLVWTPGEAQAARYDLSKKISKITYIKNEDGTYHLSAFPQEEIESGAINLGEQIKEDKLADYVGKEAAEKIINGKGKRQIAAKDLEGLEEQGWEYARQNYPQYEFAGPEWSKVVDDFKAAHKEKSRWKELSGLDLKVGGEGMKSFYDKIVPNQLSKLVKKLDPEAKVETFGIGHSKKGPTKLEDFTIEPGYNRKVRAFDHCGNSALFNNEAEAEKWMQELIAKTGSQQTNMAGVRITPRMREAIMAGLPAFSVGGIMLTPVDHNPFAPSRASGGRVEPRNIARDPSEAQKEAGNYAKDHVRIHGLDITIENAKGRPRSGTGRDGKRWSVRMPAHYGYLKKSEGSDGDHVDVYLGPAIRSPKVFVVNQRDAETGKFDEHKCFLGFGSQGQVVATYRKGFSDGKADKRLGAIVQMSVPEFKAWLKDGDTTKELKA